MFFLLFFYFCSVFCCFFPFLIPSLFKGQRGTPGVYLVLLQDQQNYTQLTFLYVVQKVKKKSVRCIGFQRNMTMQDKCIMFVWCSPPLSFTGCRSLWGKILWVVLRLCVVSLMRSDSQQTQRSFEMGKLSLLFYDASREELNVWNKHNGCSERKHFVRVLKIRKKESLKQKQKIQVNSERERERPSVSLSSSPSIVTRVFVKAGQRRSLRHPKLTPHLQIVPRVYQSAPTEDVCQQAEASS